MHRVVIRHVRRFPEEHKVMFAVGIAVTWYVVEYVMHYEIAGKGVEVCALVPAMERAFKVLCGE